MQKIIKMAKKLKGQAAMNSDKATIEERTIDLATFATRRSNDGVIIKNIGIFKLKIRRKDDSRTMGTINIAGKILPILSSPHDITSSQNEIDENSCILLLDADPTFADFKVGILVDNAIEITKVANDFL